MKLLVLAQTPPPLHGQSFMVQALLNGLPKHGIKVHHVNLRLSRDAPDIGRWRPGKIPATLGFAFRAVAARFTHGCDVLYYVPAPPFKRGALYRDWVLMAMCRPFFRRLILHWHAAGLGEWLETSATALERAITRALLGRANLAIVLAESLRRDGEALGARAVAVVPNGIADCGPAVASVSANPLGVLFLGLCSEAKGLFSAAAAVIEANRRAGTTVFVLTAAGPFEDDPSAVRFRALADRNRGALRHAGVVTGAAKERLFALCHLLCLPTRYAAEATPLVLLEALAHDRPVVATRWRGIPDVITPEVGVLVPAGDDVALAEALIDFRRQLPPPGVCRARFLAGFTIERHLTALAAALRNTFT